MFYKKLSETGTLNIRFKPQGKLADCDFERSTAAACRLGRHIAGKSTPSRGFSGKTTKSPNVVHEDAFSFLEMMWIDVSVQKPGFCWKDAPFAGLATAIYKTKVVKVCAKPQRWRTDRWKVRKWKRCEYE